MSNYYHLVTFLENELHLKVDETFHHEGDLDIIYVNLEYFIPELEKYYLAIDCTQEKYGYFIDLKDPNTRYETKIIERVEREVLCWDDPDITLEDIGLPEEERTFEQLKIDFHTLLYGLPK